MEQRKINNDRLGSVFRIQNTWWINWSRWNGKKITKIMSKNKIEMKILSNQDTYFKMKLILEINNLKNETKKNTLQITIIFSFLY